MFNKSNGRVKLKNKISKPIKSMYGVLQGGDLSNIDNYQIFYRQALFRHNAGVLAMKCICYGKKHFPYRKRKKHQGYQIPKWTLNICKIVIFYFRYTDP